MRKFEKWIKIDDHDARAARYPLCDDLTIVDKMQWVYEGKTRWFGHHFPELRCWLQLTLGDQEWTVGHRLRAGTVDLLLDTSVAEVFEAAWEDSICEKV